MHVRNNTSLFVLEDMQLLVDELEKVLFLFFGAEYFYLSLLDSSFLSLVVFLTNGPWLRILRKLRNISRLWHIVSSSKLQLLLLLRLLILFELLSFGLVSTRNPNNLFQAQTCGLGAFSDFNLLHFHNKYFI